MTDEPVACFEGPVAAYETFQEIGRDIYGWLRATDPDLDAKGSYGGWLKVLYQMTLRCPAAGFEHKLGPAVVYLDKIPDDLEPYYRVYRYTHNPFAISSAALQMFLEPYQTRFLRSFSSKIHLAPWQLACVFANPRITRVEPAEIVTSGLRAEMARIFHRSPDKRPRFMRGRKFGGRLMLGGRLLKTLSSNAKSQFKIVNEFEEQGWPDDIDTPAELGHNGGSARDAVINLNAGIEGWPKIVFTAEHNGRCIRQRIEANES
ncbi:MAG: hypothetical protein NTY19_09160 [Planctomycetota bacterium]|nr:hypothetical protein [Planctomycetota bacterium]